MVEPTVSFGTVPVDPTLAARVREVADFLAAPAVDRLTEEQRALSLGIARRLIGEAADGLGSGIDSQILWEIWFREGIPSADQIAMLCLSRAEEHRWRQRSDALVAELPTDMTTMDGAEVDPESAASVSTAPVTDTESQADQAYLALCIADRRRVDSFGNPRVPAVDVDDDVYQSLLLDIAAAGLLKAGNDPDIARQMGDDVRKLSAQKGAAQGIDAAAQAYFAALEAADDTRATIIHAIRSHEWTVVIALLAAHHGVRYDQMALQLLSADAERLGALLISFSLTDAEYAPLTTSLEAVPNRVIAAAQPVDAMPPSPPTDDGDAA